ncbi:MAG: hypothetical protein M1401_03290 [Chloroflexi bacterium]|nr:hypothetical protein [Chloroflexota bacterium]MCL5107892.1 hypothetical protein [Chloroflexota bacterium]
MRVAKSFLSLAEPGRPLLALAEVRSLPGGGRVGGFLTGAVFCLALAFAGSLPGCSSLPFAGSAALLGPVTVSPARITPDGDRVDDSATINYSLSRPAQVSLYLLDSAGRRLNVRDDVERSAGAYTAPFDGGVAGSGGAQLRQAVPNGDYTCVVVATDQSGRQEEGRAKLAVADSDSTPLRLDAVRADPGEISPFDPQYGLDTRVTYRLSKPAFTRLYVVEPDGRRTRLSEPLTEAAGEHSRLWNGVLRDKVPAAGEYKLIVQARDAGGTLIEQAASVSLRGVEEPDAAVLRVDFTPKQVAKGDLVKVEITVKNTGTVPLRTHGPDPGYVYSTRDTYASIEGGRYADESRLWRVGVDWEGSLGAEGARYPYRWGLGQDLAPGEQTTVVGYIRVLEDYPQIRLYAGLIYEEVKYQGDRLGQQLIEVSH